MRLKDAIEKAGPMGFVRHPTLNTFAPLADGTMGILYRAGAWVRPQAKSWSSGAVLAPDTWEAFNTADTTSEYFLAYMPDVNA